MTVESHNRSEHSTFKVRLVSDPLIGVIKDRDICPIICALRLQQSRAEYYSGVW